MRDGQCVQHNGKPQHTFVHSHTTHSNQEPHSDSGTRTVTQTQRKRQIDKVTKRPRRQHQKIHSQPHNGLVPPTTTPPSPGIIQATHLHAAAPCPKPETTDGFLGVPHHRGHVQVHCHLWIPHTKNDHDEDHNTSTSNSMLVHYKHAHTNKQLACASAASSTQAPSSLRAHLGASGQGVLQHVRQLGVSEWDVLGPGSQGCNDVTQSA